ncbi:MAG TPA: tetratricopeptide repeat protein [Cyclobacteriaceae bacterium]
MDSLQAVLKTLPADTNRVNVLITLCRAQSFLDSRKMISTANEALTLSRKLNFETGKARALFQLGYCFHKVGDDLKAIQSLREASSIFEEINDIKQAAQAYNGIGVIYEDQRDTNEALAYFKRAYSLWGKIDYKDGECMGLLNLGSVYEDMNKDQHALLYYERALMLSERMHNEKRIGSALFSIGSIYLKKKEYTKSLDYERRALDYFIKANSSVMQGRVYNALSQIYLNQNQPAEALRMAEQSIKLTAAITSKNDLRDGYHQASKAAEKLNDYVKAYKFQSLYIVLNDSLQNSVSAASIEKIKSKYKLEEKESAIALLREENKVIIFRRNMFIIILTGLLIISFLIYNRYRLITQRKLQLKKQLLDLSTQNLIEKSETINRINQELEHFKSQSSDESIQIVKIDKILQSNILTDDDWNSFKIAFGDIYPSFFSMLKHKCPGITVSETRLCSLIKLKLSIKEMASMLGISPESVKTSRYRLKKKLNLAENETLETFIEGIGISYNREEIQLSEG